MLGATLLTALLTFSFFWDLRSAQAEDRERGRQIFNNATPACAICHTLADAGAAGEIGPNLDKMKPTTERVRKAIESGVGVMPAYSGSLSEAEIAAVAQYVAEAAK